MQDLPFLSWLTLVDMGWIMEGLSKVCSIRGRFCVLTGDGDVFGKWLKSWSISMI